MIEKFLSLDNLETLMKFVTALKIEMQNVNFFNYFIYKGNECMYSKRCP